MKVVFEDPSHRNPPKIILSLLVIYLLVQYYEKLIDETVKV